MEVVLLVATLTALAALVLVVAAFRSAVRRKRDPDLVREEPPIPWYEQAAVLLVVVLLVGGLIAGFLVASRRLGHEGSSTAPSPGAHPGPATPATGPGVGGPPGPTATGSPGAWLPVGLAVAGLAVVVSLAARQALRRPAPARRPAQAGLREVAGLLDDTVADLRREPDARRAVVAAYARLERALGARGLGRGRAETAWEYLDRLLGELDAEPAPLRRLTGLFDRAKFSGHEVTAGMRDEAIDALLAVRDALRVGS